LPYGEGVSFWALAEMVKAQAGIREDDTLDEVSERLRHAVGELVSEKEAGWVESHLRPLAGLGGAEPGLGDRRDESFAAWRRFFEAMAERRPLVLVFEDLHWADDDLLDFVDHLAEWAGGVPLLLLGTARPELLERRPTWGGGKLNASTIMLSPLREEDTARLVGSLLDQSLLLAETQSALLERAGGNPLYAEQFARLYQERGTLDELAVPENVQGIIAARLDGLSSGEKELLQDAAVVGKVFWAGALRRDSAAVRDALHSLERKDFVRRERRSSVEDDEEYAFRHLLVRDVVYGQIPRAARADKHRRTAEWIEALGRPEDHAEMLAHHYVSAIDYARAAGLDDSELADPTRQALRSAGDRAYALNALTAAARYYEHALELWPETDETRPRLLLQLAQTQYFAGDERRERTLERAREALMAAADNEGAAEADAFLAELWWHRGQRDRSRKHLDRAQELAADLPASQAKARVLSQLSRYHALAEENEQAIELGTQAVAMAEALDLPELQAHALNNVGIAKAAKGDRGGFADLERSIEIALAANSPEAARGYNNLGAIVWDDGDFRRSVQLFDEAVRLGEQFGNRAQVRYSRGVQTRTFFRLGDWDEGLVRADAFIAACEAGDRHYLESQMRLSRAFVRLARDDTAGAVEDTRVALERAREAGDPQAILPELSDAIFIFAEAGLLDDARTVAQELLPHLRAPSIRVSLIVEAAWVADVVGIADVLAEAAERDLGEVRTRWNELLRALLDKDFKFAADKYEEIGLLDQEAYARLRTAAQRVEKGRRAEADVQLQKALSFFRSVGATRYIRQGEALLAAAS
jgi:tetratricopeptide (TPR) repeat protein